MNTLTHTRSVIAGLSALSLLALTACGNDDDAAVDTAASDGTADESTDESSNEGSQTDPAPAESVYAFAPESDLSGQEIRVELPQDLVDTAGDYAENRVFDHLIVRAGDHPESNCSIEVEYGYVDNARERIEDLAWMGHDGLDENEETIWYELDTDEKYDLAVGAETDTELDEEVNSSITPVSCAESPTDDSDVVSLGFRQITEVETPSNGTAPPETPYMTGGTLAFLDVNVMASGDIHILNSEVSGYHYSGDEHGWLSDSETVDSQGNVIDN